MKIHENTRRLVTFDVTEGMDRLTPQSFLGYMGAGGGGVGRLIALLLALKARCGARGRCSLYRDDVNDWRAEGSGVRTGEARTCEHHYFVFVGATEPKPKNKETRMIPAGVPTYWSQEL